MLNPNSEKVNKSELFKPQEFLKVIAIKLFRGKKRLLFRQIRPNCEGFSEPTKQIKEGPFVKLCF